VALARKDFDTAARMARRALDLDTRSLEAMPVAITALTSAKRHDEAVAVARSLQAQWPDEAIGFILEGEVEWARGRWDAAAQAFRVATKKPKPAQSPGRLHASLAKAGKTADAARFAGGWLTEHSKDTLFMLYLADAASQAGDRAGAERLYRQVLVVEPGNPMALNNFAVLLLAQNRPGALELAQRAVKAAPGRIALQDTLASALAQAGQTAQAIEVQKKLVAAAPRVPAYQLQLVRLYLQVGDNAAARTELKRLGAIDKPFPGREDLPELLRQAGG